MLMKWLKKLFPSVQIYESPHDPDRILDEAKQVAEEAKEVMKVHAEARKEVNKEIKTNGFYHWLEYRKQHEEDSNDQKKNDGHGGDVK